MSHITIERKAALFAQREEARRVLAEMSRKGLRHGLDCARMKYDDGEEYDSLCGADCDYTTAGSIAQHLDEIEAELSR